MLHRTSFWLTFTLLTAALAAQEPKAPAAAPTATRLQALLDELRQLDGDAWAQRVKALEQQQQALEQSAAQRRKQAKELEAQATRDDEQRAQLGGEIERLRQLQQLLDGLPQPAAAEAKPAQPQPAKSQPAQPKPAEPKPAQPKPANAAPAKPAPAKSEPAKAPPAGPAPAKPAPAEPPAPKSGDAKPAAKEAAAAKAPPTETMAAPAAKDVTYVTWADVEPIFEDNCAGCHEPDEKKGGLDLTTFAAVRTGGGSGKSVVPGQPDQSRLYRMVTQQERPFMPKDDDPLAADQLQIIQRWIEQGAAEDADAARAFAAERQAQLAAQEEEPQTATGAVAALPTAWPELDLTVPPRAAPIASLCRSPGAPLLALPGLGQVALLDGDLQLLGVLPSEYPTISRVTFATDGARLAVGAGEAGRRGRAIVHDVRTGQVLATVGKERDLPLAVALHDGLVALGGASKRARAFDWATGTPRLDGKHEDFVLGLSFAPDGKLLAAADRAGNVIVWDLARGTPETTLRGHTGAVNAVAFDRGGRTIYTVGDDGTLRSWDVREGKERWRQDAHRGAAALCLSLSPEGAIATGGSDGRIAVYSDAGRRLSLSGSVGDWLCSLGFGTDEDVVFAGCADGRVHRWLRKANQLSAHAPLQPQPAQ